jgi:hypothetical protein
MYISPYKAFPIIFTLIGLAMFLTEMLSGMDKYFIVISLTLISTGIYWFKIEMDMDD